MVSGLLRPRSLLLAHAEPSPTKRIVVAGGPGTGKTLLSARYGRPYRVRHTDELIHTHAWGEDSAAIVPWLSEPGPWVIEGTAAARALRKWLARRPDGRPCDVVVWLAEPFHPQSGGRAALSKGVATVWKGIRGELLRRGVAIEIPRPEFPEVPALDET